MKSKLMLLLLIVSFCSPSLAQTAKRKGTINRKPPVTTLQPQPVAQPPATVQRAPQPGAPISLVPVNEQTFTSADLDSTLREEVEHVEDKIAAARKSVLDVQINTMLLQLEAKKRHIDTHRLYELEVS